MEWSASLLIRNDLDELSRLAEWVADCGQVHSLPEKIAQYVDLCSAEAVTNIMTHGFTDSAAHEIAVRLMQQGEDIVLDIEDDGVAYDPTTAAPPAPATLENDRIGGWGIRIVRRFSDEVRYRRRGNRNCLTLVFRQQPSVAA